MPAASAVGALDLDLDAFEGPFDLLLTLVLREEIALAELDLAEVVVRFVEHLLARDQLDLDACGEFLVLIAALLELKARSLFEEVEPLAEVDPEQAAEELARRLALYKRLKAAAAHLAELLERNGARYFRLGPPPVAVPRHEPPPERHDPHALAAALRTLCAEPPAPSLEHMALRFPPVSQFVERWLALLSRRRRLDFDREVAGLSRIEVAVAFLALLELRKRSHVEISQAGPFAPIRILRLAEEAAPAWSVPSA